jgi:chemotaxis protein MotA
MLFLVGVFVVFGSVIGGYLMHNGNMAVLWQPNEIVIIGGAAFGAFLIANPMDIVKDCGKSLKKLLKPKPFGKQQYLELLLFIFSVCKLMKTKGMLEIESHIEKPSESDLFKVAPSLLSNHHAVQFFCDYVRLLTMGVTNPYHLEDLMEKELEIQHHEHSLVPGAISAMGDGMPALGIVAAVLGVITTMKSISEPPEVLGGLIEAALVGTFLGVLLSYGIISPIASYLGKFFDAEIKYYHCIKAAILAHVQGNAPTITVEFVRKMVPEHDRPSFKEVEEALNKGK